MTTYDMIVLGSGPAGYVAALRAAQLGLKNIAVLEADKPGGVCLNWGCIPSKSLIHQARVFSEKRELEAMGIKLDLSGFDYAKVYQQSRKVADMLSRGILYLFKKNQISFLQGQYRFVKDYVLESAAGEKIESSRIIIASGAKTKSFPFCRIDEENILSSTGALSLQKLPSKALIIGSGAIGMEFAYIWNAFGVEVTVAEIMDRIVPLEDSEMTRTLRSSFEKKGVTFLVQSQVMEVKSSEALVRVKIKGADGAVAEKEYDKVLLAVGREPDLTPLGLENTGIKTDKNAITVDTNMQTSVKGVYAAGDVTKILQLAHVGYRQGEIAAEHAVRGETESFLNLSEIPRCLYCEPEMASFGSTEDQLIQEGREYKKTLFPFRPNGKATAMQKNEGMVKVLWDEKNRMILGAHILGPEATELIHQILCFKEIGELNLSLNRMVAAHPTFSETLFENVRSFFGRAVHL